MTDHTFKIKAGLSANDSTIELDGRRLSGVTRVSFELAANKLTIVKLEIMGEVLVEGEFRKSAILRMEQANEDRHGRPLLDVESRKNPRTRIDEVAKRLSAIEKSGPD